MAPRGSEDGPYEVRGWPLRGLRVADLEGSTWSPEGAQDHAAVSLQGLGHILCLAGRAPWIGKDSIVARNLFNSRNNDRKRTKEYKRELEEMKRRIQTRPYLFEQVTKVKPSRYLFFPVWVKEFLKITKVLQCEGQTFP